MPANATATALAREFCTEVTPECPVSSTLYGYTPNLSVNSFFVALFGLCLVAQLIIGTTRRTWTYLVVLAIGELTLFKIRGERARADINGLQKAVSARPWDISAG